MGTSNLRALATIFTATTISVASHAETIGDIQCGAGIPPGDAIVCEYAVIGNKYEKLFETQFKGGRNPILLGEVRTKIAACVALPCVEDIVDQQLALTSVASIETAPQPDAPASIVARTLSVPVQNEPVRVAVDTSHSDSAAGAWVLLVSICLVVLATFGVLRWLFRLLRGPKRVDKASEEQGKSAGGTLLSLLWSAISSDSGQVGSTERVAVRPYGGSNLDGFEWDGRCLKPYGGSNLDGFEWDGRCLKPYGGSNLDGFEWDGRCLKPYDGSNLDGFEWDGRCLKPYGGSNLDGFELDGFIMKPYGKSLSEGWEASGSLPIPVWARVVRLI